MSVFKTQFTPSPDPFPVNEEGEKNVCLKSLLACGERFRVG
jgi:hypothetical protein